MLVRLLQRKRPRMELDIIAVEEVLPDVGSLVGLARELGIRGEVDASYENLPVLRVAELTIRYGEAECGHCKEQ